MEFQKIEVHFGTENGRRIAVVHQGKPVEAIFIGGSESRFFPPDQLPKKKSAPTPEIVPVVDTQGNSANDVALLDGPQVCYLIGGELQCW